MANAASMSLKRAQVILRQRERALVLAKTDGDTKVKPDFRKPGDAVELMKRRAEMTKPHGNHRPPIPHLTAQDRVIKAPAKGWRNFYYSSGTGFTIGESPKVKWEHSAKRSWTICEGWPKGHYPADERIPGPRVWPSKELAEEAGDEFCDPDTWNWSGKPPCMRFKTKRVK